MVIALPRKVRPGDPVSAAGFNALVDALAALRPTFGPGIAGRMSATGVVISLAGQDSRWTMGRVESNYPGTPLYPADLTYMVRLEDDPAVTQGPLLPRIARPAVAYDAKLRPASYGDPCYVLRVPRDTGVVDAYLWAPTEALAFAACSTSGPTGALPDGPGVGLDHPHPIPISP